MTRIAPRWEQERLYGPKGAGWTDENAPQRIERTTWDDPIPPVPGDSYSDRYHARRAFRAEFESGIRVIVIAAVVVPILLAVWAISMVVM